MVSTHLADPSPRGRLEQELVLDESDSSSLGHSLQRKHAPGSRLWREDQQTQNGKNLALCSWPSCATIGHDVPTIGHDATIGHDV